MNTRIDPVISAHATLIPLSLADLPGFDVDDHAESWKAFRLSCVAIMGGREELRRGLAPSRGQINICERALRAPEVLTSHEARSFYASAFAPYLIQPHHQTPGRADQQAFFTAYYRPEVAASLEKTRNFREPLFARPSDLVTLGPDGDPGIAAGLTSARQASDGRLAPYPIRSEIDRGTLGALARPVAYVEDAIEAFMIQVQGSARLRLQDGRAIDLTYAGRNGHPYVSIGKILLAEGEIEPSQMSLETLKSWVRKNGQGLGERGRELLHRNPSFVFFSAAPADEVSPGPIGAAGLPLTAHRSIAVDRHLWPYGLPFWIDADLPWQSAVKSSLARMMIAQDTGSAILGPARADLYFGSGAAAGDLAGGIRHHGRMFVLLPSDALS